MSELASGIVTGLASTVTGAIQNKRNRNAQEIMNATNIYNANKQIEKQHQWSLEDRAYNSEAAQYARLIGIGMSPAMARAAITGGITASQLGDVNTALPQGIAPQSAPLDFGQIGAASQMMFQRTEADKQRSHEIEMQRNEIEWQKEQSEMELVLDEFGRKAVSEAEPIAQEAWRSVLREARNAGKSLASMSREEIEEWLLGENTSVYDELVKASANPVVDRLLNMKFERNQAQDNASLAADSMLVQQKLTEAQTELQNISKKQIEQVMKYYPHIAQVEVALKRSQIALNGEEMKRIIADTTFMNASASKRLAMLGIELEEKTVRAALDEWNTNKSKVYERLDKIDEQTSNATGVIMKTLLAVLGVSIGSKAVSEGLSKKTNPFITNPTPQDASDALKYWNSLHP